MTSSSPTLMEERRERIAQIIDPWSFHQCEWAIQQDDDALLKVYLPTRDIALTKADKILAILSDDPSLVLREALEKLATSIEKQVPATRHYLVQNSFDANFADILLSHYNDFARDAREALAALARGEA